MKKERNDVELAKGVQIKRRNGRWYITNAKESKLSVFGLAQELLQITAWSVTVLKEDHICLELTSDPGKTSITITDTEVTYRVTDPAWFETSEGQRIKQFLDKHSASVYDSGSRNNISPDSV